MSRLPTEIGDFLPLAGNVFGRQFLVRREMNSLGTFPTNTSGEAWSNFKQSTCRRCLFMTEEDNSRRNIFGFEFCNLRISFESQCENIPLPLA